MSNKLVAPKLRPGAIVVADDVGAFWANSDDYLSWVRDPSNGVRSSMLRLDDGTEMSLRMDLSARAEAA